MDVQQHRSSDIISTLPQNLIEKILTLMPIRDALRTSTLSTNWRYHWMSMPKFVFDDRMFNVPPNSNKLLKKHKFLEAMFHCLLLHRGLILGFTLSFHDVILVSEIDRMILHLSMSNCLKEFTLETLTIDYELPSSFFKLQGLEQLVLKNYDLEPRTTFNGFMVLVGDNEKEAGDELTCVELLECLPCVMHLELSKYYIKFFAAGDMLHKFSTLLVPLKSLNLEVCFLEPDEFCFAVCLIKSSPELEKLALKMYDNDKLPLPSMELDPQNYPGFNLDHLKEFEIISFGNLAYEMEFVKLVLAKSPMLKKARVELDANLSVNDELQMFRDLIKYPFRRASPTAKLIIERPKASS
ncbi:F-box/FBD/LRR-repeat protein-like protein [Tanacetum coccineum]